MPWYDSNWNPFKHVGSGLEAVTQGLFGRSLKPDDKVGIENPKLESGDFLRGQIKSALGGIGGGAPQLGEADLAGQGQFRSRQMGLADMLGRIGSGQQRGAGELAVQRQSADAMANQAALSRLGRGGNAAASALQGARGAAQIGQQATGQASQAALGDQANALGLQGQVLGQGRGQDIGIAGLLNQRDIANQNAALQSRGMDIDERLGLLSQLTGIDQAELLARIQQAQLAAGQRDPGIFGDLLQAGGTVLAAKAGA